MNSDKITLIINDNTQIPFKRSLLDKLEGLKVLEKEGKSVVFIDVDEDVEPRHVMALTTILTGGRLIPVKTFGSHRDVLTTLKLAESLNVSTAMIDLAFNGWTEHPKWIDLWYPQYLYLIYIRKEDLVDFKKFFNTNQHPFDSYLDALLLPEVLNNPELLTNISKFYKNFTIESLFKVNNDAVLKRIELLEKDRNDIWASFLINPHAPLFKKYFEHNELVLALVASYPVWSSEGISVVNPPQIGESTIADFDTAIARLKEFSYGMLDKSPNPNWEKPFPWGNVILAGGSISKLLGKNYNKKNAKASDLDIFIYGNTFEEKAKVLEDLVNWFYIPSKDGEKVEYKTFYAIRGSVTTVYIKDIPRKFLLISCHHNNPYSVISRFDLTHILWCFWGGKFHGTPEALIAMKEKIARFGNTGRLRPNRLIKALHCGYSIYKEADVIDKYVDITELLKPEEGDNAHNIHLQKMLRELYGYYYPKSDDEDDDPEETRNHILCMIEKDSNATLVATDTKFVLNNITVGGNFENDYESIIYTTFHANNIAYRNTGRRNTKQIIRSKHGVIRLTSGILKVHRIINNEGGIEILFKVEEEGFKEFVLQLEGPVYRIFRNGGVTRHIINEADGMETIRFHIPRYRLDMLVSRGFSCMRSQRGVPLNVEEELKEGDQVQVMFLMEAVMMDNNRAIELKPVRFVKYCKYDPKDGAAPVIEDSDTNVENEINKLTEDEERVSDSEDEGGSSESHSGNIAYEDDVIYE